LTQSVLCVTYRNVEVKNIRKEQRNREETGRKEKNEEKNVISKKARMEREKNRKE